MQIGIRESRMVEGEYKLTGNEIRGLCRFPDAIAVANYDIDIHSPDGTGTSHYYFAKDEWYQIPYRCLIPKSCENLLMAGRCISSDRKTNSAIRVKASCMAMGEAIGTAAAIAIRNNIRIADISIDELKCRLSKNGAIVPGLSDGKEFAV